MSDASPMPDYVVIGTVLKPHGIRGALKVQPETDDPQRFNKLDRVFVRYPTGNRAAVEIRSVQFVNRGVLLTLQGIESRNDAERLRGATLEIPGDQVLPLAENEYYYFQLIGLQVVAESGEPIGKVEDIISYPANDVFVVRMGEREVLIPDVPDIICKVDLQNGCLVINPLPGLLD